MTTQSTQAELQRASALVDLERYAEAADRAQSVLAREPDNPNAAAIVAQAALGLGDHTRALGMARRAASAAAEWWWPYYLMSLALTRLDSRAQAVQMAGEAVRLAPGECAAHIRVADALLGAQRLPEARRAAERAVELGPNAVGTHYVTGRVAFAEGRKDDATAAFNRALAINPDHAPSHNELARMRLGAGRGTAFRAGALADAAGGFATAIRANPRDEQVRRNLDLTTLAFLRLTAYFVFIAAFFGSNVAANGHNSFDKDLPLILLVLPLGYAARFLLGLQPQLRRYVWDLVRRRSAVRTPMALLAISVGLIVAEVLASTKGTKGALAAAAVVLALASRVLLWRHRSKVRGG